MESAFFACSSQWIALLPEGVKPARTRTELWGRAWELLVLTPEGCRQLGEGPVRCRELLMPGDCPPALLQNVEAKTVVAYGLSPRDSLTFSSLTEPVLCIQRALPRPDGAVIEPQELPLPPLPESAEKMLPLLGLWLLQMPLTGPLLP